MNKICRNCPFYMEDVNFLNYSGCICFYPRTLFEHGPILRSLSIEEYNQDRPVKYKSWQEYIHQISKTGHLIFSDDQRAADVDCNERYMTDVCYTDFDDEIPFYCFYKFEREMTNE